VLPNKKKRAAQHFGCAGSRRIHSQRYHHTAMPKYTQEPTPPSLIQVRPHGLEPGGILHIGHGDGVMEFCGHVL
jgi:hypothetical protein